MRDFQKEFKQRVAKIEGKLNYMVRPQEILYNIHKRSLPPGIDKVVGIGFTKLQAVYALQNLFKAHVDLKESGRWTYYDIVAQDATQDEMSIYFNPKSKVKKD